MDNLNYGVIGNCKTAALISETGSIEWCCMPNFNSFSVFAKILDKDIGGSFEFNVDEQYKIEQSYIRKTNILVTKFKKRDDIFEVIDFMPRYLYDQKNYYAPPDIIRYIKYISGKPAFRIKYDPKLEFAKNPTKTIIQKNNIKSFTTKGTYDSLYL
ncbi:MAG: glycoside hydrolase family 15 protein, partial [Bacteroidales bacterium]|nr:glycoside hydrolase family 15 protein [Bacteroidales bacterium]